jgi:hypothetical protein
MSFNSIELINKAINLLKGAGAEYSIIGHNGVVYSNSRRTVKPERKWTNDNRYEYGERTDYIRKYVGNLDCGTVVDIPFGKYDGKALRGSLGAYLSKEFGAGNTTTSIDHGKKIIQVLRME